MIETDAQLLERVGQGDQAAFESLFLRYYARVYRVAYNLVGCREEAEDLAQETLLVLYYHPPHPDVGTGLAAWLSRVALNQGYNALRSERRTRQRIERLDMPADTGDLESTVVRSEERAEVRSVIARLPDRQGKLLLLRYAGFSYAEIAAVLEIAPGSVGTLLARAERAFVKLYQEMMPAVDVLKGGEHDRML